MPEGIPFVVITLAAWALISLTPSNTWLGRAFDELSDSRGDGGEAGAVEDGPG